MRRFAILVFVLLLGCNKPDAQSQRTEGDAPSAKSDDRAAAPNIENTDGEESNLTKGLSCYEVGYRYGVCVGSELSGKKYPQEYNFVTPERCRNNEENAKGVAAGMAEAMSGSATPSSTQESSPVISKKEYMKSAKFIGLKKDPIYIKDFMKNPDKYKDQRVKINVKIMSIKEQDGNTLMNVYLTPDYEVGLVLYKGSVDVYDDDVIAVYGDVIGTVEGKNGMGADMAWPAILARYIKKLPYE